MADTAIEWTERSWNPIVGCSLATPGCTHCYAMAMAARIERMGTAPHYAGLTQPTKAGAVWTGKLALAPEHVLLEPLRRKKPTTYFVNSMGDLFHEGVSEAWIDRVFAVMALTPQHTYQVLTKRAARMRTYMEAAKDGIVAELRRIEEAPAPGGSLRRASPEEIIKWNAGAARFNLEHNHPNPPWPLPNVWLGVSAEDQRRADERIPELLATPAAIRFVSAEPLLGPIDFRHFRIDESYSPDSDPHNDLDTLTGIVSNLAVAHTERRAKLDWIIVGGESGPNARPMHPDWARSIRDQCAGAGTAFFFKQWGEWFTQVDRDRDDPDWRFDYSHRFADTRKGVAWLNLEGGRGFHGERFHVMGRVGKKEAGRTLDDVEHDAMPEGRA